MNFELINTNLLFILLGVGIGILGLGLALYGIFIGLKRGNNISSRLDHFITVETQTTANPIEGQIIPREITGSLFSRTIALWMKNFIKFLERLTPERMAINMEHKLTIAGNPGNMHAGQFFAIRALLLLGGIFVAFLINRDFKNISTFSAGFGILIIVIFFFLPVAWLNGLVQSKQFAIRRELPNALDMLSVCADAGLGFDQSLQKISNYWDTELGHELKRVTQEIEMGATRGEALKNMSNRLDVEDLSRFISIIIQAEMIGMSYADVLHSQALQMRVLRQYWAREIANKLPAKMIIPLALFIFPALIAVILGPTIPTILNLFKILIQWYKGDMPTISTPESKQPMDNDPEPNEKSGQIKKPTSLSNDSDYQKLIELYQHAEFDKCKELLGKLEQKFPGHPKLLKFKDDLQMQLFLKTSAVTNKKEQEHRKRKVTIKKGVFAIVSTIFLVTAIFVSYYFINKAATASQLEAEAIQLSSFQTQAEQLLLAGQPQPAAVIVEKMTAIDPEFEGLAELKSRTEDLLRLETDYKSALYLISENKNTEALVILNQIENEKPGMWDVSHQIELIEISLQIAKYMEEGNAAYQVERWDQVIAAYENALTLDPKLDDPMMKEQLLNAYLKKIIGMLQNENASIDDIEKAELYHRRAVAMIPQNKAFASERGNLQEVSSNLLELKFTQTARAILEDKNQTTTSIAKAVSYFK